MWCAFSLFFHPGNDSKPDQLGKCCNDYFIWWAMMTFRLVLETFLQWTNLIQSSQLLETADTLMPSHMVVVELSSQTLSMVWPENFQLPQKVITLYNKCIWRLPSIYINLLVFRFFKKHIMWIKLLKSTITVEIILSFVATLVQFYLYLIR